MTVTDHPELVAALLAVSGVAAAAVEPDDDGPGTLRLQLEPGADEVGVAGEVNRLLRSRFGLAVDADRVRVVDEPTRPADLHDSKPEQTAPPPVEVEEAEAERAQVPPLPDVTVARPGRLVIERVALVSAGLGTTVSVSLGLDGQSYEGSAEGTSTAGSLHRSVAGATLRAVEAVVDGSVRFDVEHVEIATTGPDRTALVVLTMVTERATQRLSGASVVREDVRQAVIRAVLAAVNRRVEPLLGEVVV
ncbi:MAG: hypothetical protein LH461_05620 [Spirochaetaceae bacterium]|nr:hypothetical protein [Spirochaetaceae bacterium]